jgi:hypothetical protein
MATKQAPKKTVTKKPASKAATTTAKKPAATRKTTASKKTAAMQSFRVYKPETSFTTFKPSRQTAYWIIILAIITIAQLIVLKYQLDIIELTQPITM